MRRTLAVIGAAIGLLSMSVPRAAAYNGELQELPADVEQISVGGPAEAEDFGGTAEPSMSDDGRYVAFLGDIGPKKQQWVNDFYRTPHIVLRDRLLGTTIDVDVDADGNHFDGPTFCPTMSGDGSTLFFWARAEGLGGPLGQIFAYDIAARVTSIVSTTPLGVPTKNEVFCKLNTTRDGSLVSFEVSNYTDLVDTKAPQYDTVIKDRRTGLVELAGPDVQYWGAYGATLSADGTKVAYQRHRDGGGTHLFVRDRVLNVTTELELGRNRRDIGASVWALALSDNGRYLAIQTDSTEVSPGNPLPPTVTGWSVIVHDLLTGTRRLASTDSAGVPLPGETWLAGMDGSGRRLAMSWNARPGEPSNPVAFVKDLGTGKFIEVGFRPDLEPVDAWAGEGAADITPDGEHVLFMSRSRFNNDPEPAEDFPEMADVFHRGLPPEGPVCRIEVGLPAVPVIGLPFYAVGRVLDSLDNPSPGAIVRVVVTTATGAIQLRAITDASGGFRVPVTVALPGVVRLGVTVDLGDEQCEVSVGSSVITPTPSLPLNVAVDPGNGFVTVRWQPPATPGIGPVLGYWVSAVQPGRAATRRWVPGDVTSASIDKLVNGLSVIVAVAAGNSAGAGPVASPAYVFPVAGLPPATAAGAPTNLALTAGATSLTARWAPPATDGGAPVLAYSAVAIDRNTRVPMVWRNVAADERAVSLPGLKPGRVYDVAVSAVTAKGFGAAATFPGAILNPSAPAPTPAAPPGYVVATPTSRGAFVAWGPSGDDKGAPVIGYSVVVVQAGKVLDWLTFGPLVRNAAVSGLAPGVPAQVYVMATTAAGIGNPGAPAVVTATA